MKNYTNKHEPAHAGGEKKPSSGRRSVSEGVCGQGRYRYIPPTFPAPHRRSREWKEERQE